MEVETNFQKVKVKEFLSRGITILDKKSVYFSYDTKIGKDSIIYPNVYFGKEVEVGINVKIKSFSHLEGAIIKNNCEIGPFARIRPDSTIYDSVRIGNFVEIKKSEIKNNAKIPHLSYIGDSTVGSETNIGAGTITCNYDGIRKNKTKIGKHCFIGSNTSLIAPLSIGDNAIIGAGSVIKKMYQSSVIIYGKPKIVRKNKKISMCGIFGIVGEDSIVEKILGSLTRLEYRGYDSSGIAISDSEKENIVFSSRR